MRDALGRMQRIVVVGTDGPLGAELVSRWERASRGLTVDRLDLAAQAPAPIQAESLGTVLADGGDVDVVLVSARVASDAPDWSADAAAAERFVDGNVRAPVTLAVAAVAGLRAQGHGALVWVAAARNGDPVVEAHVTTVEQHLRALGRESAVDGVQVLVVRPDPTGTASASDLADAVDDGLREGSDVVGGTPQVRRVVSGLRDLSGQVLRRDKG